ncbi:MAG: O-antigen ligase family protein [Acidobacteriota bacterium]|nr:O-antigen ligase family protein [Acidobacteriota bacterium]
MKFVSAAVLWFIVTCAVFTSWVHARWPTSVPEAAIFCLAAAWGIAGLTGAIRIRFSIAMIPLSLILIWAAIQIGTGITIYSWQTKVSILYWGCNLATFFIALQVSSSARSRSIFLQTLVLLGLLLSLIGPLQELYGGGKVLFFFTPDPHFIPQFGPFPYRNQYAAFIELLLPVALYRAFTDEQRRAFYLLVSAIMYASMVAAGSRMGFVLGTSEMVAVPALLYFSRRLRMSAIRNNALLFGAIFIMLVVAAGPAEMLVKFHAPDPYAGRREYTESSLKMIQSRPVTGFGLGAWATAYPGFATFDDGLVVNEAHNDWAQWTAEGGFIMLGFMLWFAAWAVPRALKSVWGVGVLAIFVHSLVDYPIQRVSVALPMFIMLGAIAMYRSNEDPA